jgi:FKBP-type peptidyl-prolyl cis-trans isomerase 2
VRKYSLVNNETGEEHFVELEPEDAEGSRDFWKKLGWTLFEMPQ